MVGEVAKNVTFSPRRLLVVWRLLNFNLIIAVFKPIFLTFVLLICLNAQVDVGGWKDASQTG